MVTWMAWTGLLVQKSGLVPTHSLLRSDFFLGQYGNAMACLRGSWHLWQLQLMKRENKRRTPGLQASTAVCTYGSGRCRSCIIIVQAQAHKHMAVQEGAEPGIDCHCVHLGWNKSVLGIIYSISWDTFCAR